MKYSVLFFLSLFFNTAIDAQELSGAWMRKLDTAVQYLTIVDRYMVITTFDLEEKKFFQTRGGAAQIDAKKNFWSN